MHISLLKSVTPIALALVLNALLASTAAAWPEENRAVLVPALARVAPGASQQFRAIQLPKRMQVSRPASVAGWSVNGVPGGNNTVGRIDANGRYQAPAAAPAPAVVHIAANVSDVNNSTLYGTVLLGDSPGYRSLSQWPAGELEKASVVKPMRIALDGAGHAILVDTLGGRLCEFTTEGAYVGPFGKGPKGESPNQICMVAVSPAGLVFSGDVITGPPRINAYNTEGTWQFGFAPKGSRPGMVMQPSGVAFHPDGRIYLADMDGMRISVFDVEHNFLHYLRDSAPEGNRTNFPSDVAFDGAGDLFVASAFGPCEKVDADSGERVLSFAYPLPPDGLMYIDDICVDRWGDVYLAVRSGADPVQSGPFQGGVASIMKYTNTGEFLTEIRLSAEEPAWISIAVDGEGKIYAAYSTEVSERLEEFEEPGAPEDTKPVSAAPGRKVTGGVEVFVQE